MSARPLPPIFVERTLQLQEGETLTHTLMRAGFSSKEAHSISHPLQQKAAKGELKLTRLRPGDDITVTYKEDHGRLGQLESVSFIAPQDKIATVEANGGSYSAKIKQRLLEKRRAVAVGEINGSLYLSAKKANLPVALVPAFANLFAYELDFTRDIHPGDAFRVVYEEVLDENGEYVRSGNIVAAELIAAGKTRNAFRFKNSYGQVEYYDAKGQPKKKLLLRTPLEFTRISSHFNPNRKHPILGYTKAHKGTDFAAPTGTPIKAAGSGVIARKLWNGGYGKYIQIRHNAKYKTAYAHMHRYAPGMKVGKQVKQGQIIGYVGTTGRSTGPHLHYEVHVNNRQVNPLRAKLPAGNPLHKKYRAKFNRMVASIQDMWKREIQVAGLRKRKEG